MAKSKKNKIMKAEKYVSEDQEEIKRFIKIIIVLIVLVGGIYLLTRIFITKDLFQKENKETTVPGEINYNIATIGNMLSKSEEEYYVIIYNRKDDQAVYYETLVNRYKQNENAKTVYGVDLESEFNKQYYDKDNVNLNTQDVSKIRVGDLTLIKVKKGKIAESFTKEEEIAKELAYKDTKK